ncbi:hypothetical protein MMPV_008818 [Pyropia vietnamensis]
MATSATAAFVGPAYVRATSWTGAAVCASPAGAVGGPSMSAEPYASSNVRVPVKPPTPPPEPVSVETPKSKAVPFMKKPEGLIESQDGWSITTSAGRGGLLRNRI